MSAMPPPLPTLFELLVPQTRTDERAAPLEEEFKFVYNAGDDIFKGTNDEVLGWNTKRPDWFGFISKGNNRWYVHKEDLTPASLALALKELAEKEQARAERSRLCKAAEALRIASRQKAGRDRSKFSLLDGKEEEIRLMQEQGATTHKIAALLSVSRGALKRKIEKMEEQCG